MSCRCQILWREIKPVDFDRCLKEVESLARILKVLEETTHNGFPIVKRQRQQATNENDNEGAETDECTSGAIMGLILRSQLIVLLENEVWNLHLLFYFKRSYKSMILLEEVAFHFICNKKSI